jgi:hypothetical protein
MNEWMNSKPQSVPAIAELWRSRIESIYGEPPPPLTGRQFGQLKRLLINLQEMTWDVVYRVLSIWPQFSEESRIAAGLSSTPARPHIGFLLVHCGTAVNLLHSWAKNSTSSADAEFVKLVDRKIYEQMRELAKDACEGDPDLLSKVEAASSTEELRQLLAKL